VETAPETLCVFFTNKMMDKQKNKYHFNVNGCLSSVKEETFFTNRAVVL
jgi:hypothetical protein